MQNKQKKLKKLTQSSYWWLNITKLQNDIVLTHFINFLNSKPFTLKILLVILFIVCHTILMI